MAHEVDIRAVLHSNLIVFFCLFCKCLALFFSKNKYYILCKLCFGNQMNKTMRSGTVGASIPLRCKNVLSNINTVHIPLYFFAIFMIRSQQHTYVIAPVSTCTKTLWSQWDCSQFREIKFAEDSIEEFY